MRSLCVPIRSGRRAALSSSGLSYRRHPAGSFLRALPPRCHLRRLHLRFRESGGLHRTPDTGPDPPGPTTTRRGSEEESAFLPCAHARAFNLRLERDRRRDESAFFSESFTWSLQRSLLFRFMFAKLDAVTGLENNEINDQPQYEPQGSLSSAKLFERLRRSDTDRPPTTSLAIRRSERSLVRTKPSGSWIPPRILRLLLERDRFGKR